jgi:hypothetical protein
LKPQIVISIDPTRVFGGVDAKMIDAGSDIIDKFQ